MLSNGYCGQVIFLTICYWIDSWQVESYSISVYVSVITALIRKGGISCPVLSSYFSTNYEHWMSLGTRWTSLCIDGACRTPAATSMHLDFCNGLTFPHAPSPITTNFSCLSRLSSSESDITPSWAPSLSVESRGTGKQSQVAESGYQANHRWIKREYASVQADAILIPRLRSACSTRSLLPRHTPISLFTHLFKTGVRVFEKKENKNYELESYLENIFSTASKFFGIAGKAKPET